MTPAARARILVVDDHFEMARLIGDQLGDEGYEVDVAQSGEEALALGRTHQPDLVITDLRMAGVDGLDVLEAMLRLEPTTPVILMTAFGAIESAVEAMKRGAYHYLTKPFQLKELLVIVERGLRERRLRDENRSLRRLAEERCRLEALVGRSRVMQALYDRIERVAQASVPVLIRGESGTGKELVARAIHFRGPRRERAFVGVNCSALPAALLESELFGHVKGSFTGAATARRGLFLEADGGTLLLDEIGDMPAELQAKLLRVIENGEIRAVGSDITRRVEVRLLAATHQPLEERVREGKFRGDLFFRLNVLPLLIPPLRERPEDIPLLVDHFLAQARARNPGARTTGCSRELIARLVTRAWPGNVRELENLVERLVILGTHEIVGPEELDLLQGPPDSPAPGPGCAGPIRTLKQLEDEYIQWAIAQCGGNKTRAAELLAIDVSTIHRRERAGR